MDSVDIQDKSWNLLEDYIWKWWEVLQNRHELAFGVLPRLNIGTHSVIIYHFCYNQSLVFIVNSIRRKKIIANARRTFKESSQALREDERSKSVSRNIENLLDSLKGNKKERARAIYLIEGDGPWCLVPNWTSGYGPYGEELSALQGLDITEGQFPGKIRKELR